MHIPKVFGRVKNKKSNCPEISQRSSPKASLDVSGNVSGRASPQDNFDTFQRTPASYPSQDRYPLHQPSTAREPVKKRHRASYALKRTAEVITLGACAATGAVIGSFTDAPVAVGAAVAAVLGAVLPSMVGKVGRGMHVRKNNPRPQEDFSPSHPS